MTTTMTSSERLERLDREVEDLKQAFVEAAQQLVHAPEVDDSYDKRWGAIAQRLREMRADLLPADYDKEQLGLLYAALFDIRDLLDETQSLDTIDQLLIATERIRHVVRDALDEHVTGACEHRGLAVDDLSRLLPGTNRADIAEIVGVDRRTLARWAKQSGPPTRRLATAARLVAILRHNWSEEGIVAWFHRPRRDLEGRSPIAVLSERNFDEQALVSAARAGRSMYAS